MKLRSILSATVLSWFALACNAALAGERTLTIATGPSTGVYHQVGASICRFLRMRHTDHNLTCRATGSAGSIANVISLRSNTTALALVQSDIQHHAYNGTSVFKRAGADKRLRAVFSFLPETFSVVVRGDDDISELMDLKGRSVNLGAPGSGQRVVMRSLMEHVGWSAASFEFAPEISSALQTVNLCNRRIDAAIFMVAHPNIAMQDALRGCDAVLIPILLPSEEKFFTEHPYFIRTNISANAYRAITDPVPSFGVVATLLASSDTPSEAVYHVVKSVFENLEEMKKLTPAFANLNVDFMLSEHHTAPWHPGALKYFREAGLK